jgi:hypothetical protein
MLGFGPTDVPLLLLLMLFIIGVLGLSHLELLSSLSFSVLFVIAIRCIVV